MLDTLIAMIVNIIESFIEQHLDKYPFWWWICIGFGLYFKYDNLKYTCLDVTAKWKKVIAGIVIIFGLTILSANIEAIETVLKGSDYFINFAVIAYCFKCLINRCVSGEIESVFLIVNCLFVTKLSFTSFPYNIIIALIILAISVFLFKKLRFESKSGFWEIVLLCSETILMAIAVEFFDLKSFVDTFLMVLFTETALFLLNVGIMYTIKNPCGEDAEEYLREIKGTSHLSY